MNPSPPKTPLVVPRTSRREIYIAVGAGLVLIGFIVFGIMHMGRSVSGDLTGIITEKTFEPFKETRISLGSQGLRSQQVEGDYLFNVRVEGDRDYTVWADRTIYEAKKVGDSFRFPRPPAPASSDSP